MKKISIFTITSFIIGVTVGAFCMYIYKNIKFASAESNDFISKLDSDFSEEESAKFFERYNNNQEEFDGISDNSLD